MINPKTNIQKRWRIIVILSFVFLSALIIQDVVREVIVFNRDLAMFEDEFYRDVQDDVKDLVVSTEKGIQYEIEHTEEHIIDLVSSNLDGVVTAANAINVLHQTKPLNEIQLDIIEMIQVFNNTDLSREYFVFDLDGIQLLDGYTNTMTNIDRYLETDYLNRAYMKSLIDGIVSSDTHDMTETFFIVENDIIEEYVIYAVEVEDTDLIFAEYVKVSDFVANQIQETIQLLAYINDNTQNNVYIISGEGVILFHQNDEAIGLTIDDTTYPIWADTIQLIISFIQNNDEGYLEYEFYSNYANGVLKDKVAYVKYIEEWDVILGASSDIDIYDDVFEAYRADNFMAVLLIKIPAYIIIITLSIFMFVFVKNNVNLSKRILIEEERLYRKFADLTSEIILITDKHGEIVFTNKQGRQNIFGKRVSEEKVYFDQILVEEEGYFILYGIKEDMFVKFITEQVEYNNEPADLYIIMNVTEKIRTERKLEALSMIDELTNLGNRRMMVKDYNDEILDFVKHGGVAYLAMIDLDDFKPANDIYGHSYGDKILEEIAQIFSDKSSDNVRFYRIGGDEFSIVFKNLNQEEILEFIQDLQQEIGKYPYEKNVEIGFSAGVSLIQVDDSFRRFSDFFDRADKLLYKSKAEGKNMINF